MKELNEISKYIILVISLLALVGILGRMAFEIVKLFWNIWPI